MYSEGVSLFFSLSRSLSLSLSPLGKGVPISLSLSFSISSGKVGPSLYTSIGEGGASLLILSISIAEEGPFLIYVSTIRHSGSTVNRNTM